MAFSKFFSRICSYLTGLTNANQVSYADDLFKSLQMCVGKPWLKYLPSSRNNYTWNAS